MIYNRTTQTLFDDEHNAIKQFHCPLNKQWEYMSLTNSDTKRFCGSCHKNVYDLTPYSQQQIIALFDVNPEACAHLNFFEAKEDFTIISTVSGDTPQSTINRRVCRDTSNTLPIVQTIRDIEGITAAARAGKKLVIVANNNDAPINDVALILEDDVYVQQSNHGVGHFKSNLFNDCVSEGTQSTAPSQDAFAAYIIPPGIEANTRVFVPDVIEHHVAVNHRDRCNFGKQTRTNSATATWNGVDLDFHFSKSVICG